MKTRSILRVSLILTAFLAVLAAGAARVLAQPAAVPGLIGQATAAPAIVDSPGKFAVVTKLVFGHIDFVTVIIGILSIVSVTFIIRLFMQVREKVILPPESTEQIREMITNRKFQELIDYTEADPSFISKVINPALKRAPKFDNMKEAMEIAIGEQTADAFRKIEILNIIGNLGPLLGLLGTVLGMMESFYMMNAAGGNANPSVLSGGIATALAHTFLGLFLAIPNLAAFGFLRQMTDRLTTRAAIVSEDLLQLMKPSDTKPAMAPTPARPPAVSKV